MATSDSQMEAIKRPKVRMVGAGGIGCELLKTLALSGVQDIHIKWPGLPRGVRFDPSDEELMWHLLAEIGEAERHPFIGEFITSLNEDDGFRYSSPHKLPGVKQDGSLSYFFHRSLKAYENNNRKHKMIKDNDSGTIRWQEIGKTKPVYVDGVHKGSKNMMVLFMSAAVGEKPEKTNWMMHQYHVGTGKDVVGELVLSKIFYQLKCTQGDSNANGLCIDATEAVGMKVDLAVDPTLIGFEPRAKNSNMISMEIPNQDSSLRSNINIMEKCFSRRVKDGMQSSNAQYLQEECHLQTARHHAKSIANPLMASPHRAASGSQFAVDQSLPSPVLEAICSDENEESRNLLMCQASAAEVRLAIISRGPGHLNDMDIATRSSMTAPCHPEVTSPSDPLSVRCKSQQSQEESYKYLDEACISGARPVNPVQDVLDHNDKNHPSSTVPPVFPHEVKAEPLEESSTKCITQKNAEELSSPFPETDVNFNKNLSTLVQSSCSIRPKLEPVDSYLLGPSEGPPSILPEISIIKRECASEQMMDFIDHIPLRERMQRLTSSSVTKLSCDKIVDNVPQALPPPEYGSSDAVNAKTKPFSLRRKRKKTATDSVETALEEDAPGLLQILLDKGITVEEIKLFGDVENGAALPSCSSENSFEELEAVITKLFSDGPSIFKFPSVRQIKGSKAIYCLACLISLIEQARYLHFRQSPVEWGWCRDLQSFIFVFERHNRIVLERPEYGYATYFFEFMESLPVDWQIKRLVTTMKLPCCSRTILLENKPLLVGEDLTEGEARVMEEYGWVRNTGLGTLLNYCDRVVHDKKNEMYSLEWRSKIGELLKKGHDCGRTVLSTLPKKAGAHHIEYQNPEVKLENIV